MPMEGRLDLIVGEERRPLSVVYSGVRAFFS